ADHLVCDVARFFPYSVEGGLSRCRRELVDLGGDDDDPEGLRAGDGAGFGEEFEELARLFLASTPRRPNNHPRFEPAAWAQVSLDRLLPLPSLRLRPTRPAVAGQVHEA